MHFLEKERKITIATQNVDGLHGLAGSTNVLELHGSLQRGRCRECSNVVPIGEVHELLSKGIEDPLCSKCKNFILPDIVFFGENLAENIAREAFTEAKEAALCLVIGSSLEVSPADILPFDAKEAGKPVIILNEEPTPFDESATVVLRGKAEVVLPALVRV